MTIDSILTELVIFAKERGADEEPEFRSVIKAAERHLEDLRRHRAKRSRLSRQPECERCCGPSTSGILCWDCIAAAPFAIRNAFRNASGLDGIRDAAEQIRTWIRTSSHSEERRHAA
jgi:hypothetical protein